LISTSVYEYNHIGNYSAKSNNRNRWNHRCPVYTAVSFKFTDTLKLHFRTAYL